MQRFHGTLAHMDERQRDMLRQLRHCEALEDLHRRVWMALTECGLGLDARLLGLGLLRKPRPDPLADLFPPASRRGCRGVSQIREQHLVGALCRGPSLELYQPLEL